MLTEKTLNRIKKFLTAGLLAVLAVTLVTVNLRGASAKKAEADGLYFTDMRLQDLTGGVYTAADLYRNALTVFTVWNPYCTACIREMPLLSALDREYAPQRVRFVGIEGEAYQYPEDVEKAIALYESSGAENTQLLADQAFTEEILPRLNNAYPGTFIVDGRGRIRDFFAGSLKEEEWRARIDGLLALTVNTAG